MSKQLEIIKLSEKYAKQAALILAESFMDEPMQQVLDTTLEDVLEFMEHVVRYAIPEKLSAVAIDSQLDKVVAVIVNKDFAKEPIEDDDPFSERLLPIFELLDQLDHKYREDHNIQQNDILHNFMMGVDRNYRNQDLSTAFFNFCVTEGRKRGFKMMLTEVTGPISLHVTLKRGFKKYHAIRYADFCFNNTYPFKDIEGAEYCHLVYRPLPSLSEQN